MDTINPFAPHAWVSSIDWSRPWLASVARIGQPMVAQIAQGLPVHAALNQYLPAALQEAGLRFVPQEALPDGVAYETFIREQRCVPTRDHLHDVFNGLIWLHWPQLKLHLNQLQAQAIARDGVGQRRGPLRDAITVLDENGAIWLAPQPLVEALRARQWQRLMVELRPLWAQSCLWPVGHALLEKLVQPRKPMTAHVLCLPWTPDTVAALQASGDAVSSALDAHMARDMLVCADVLATKPFSPLPVLGVPGWWAQNEELSFYDDPLVFRAARPTT
ncbi:MAG: DUF3025 domain-containing protein [Comamonadaceae bacterium]|nr:DUF3025 domain-containing protein [Comamonadaceae bacterium]